MEFYFILAALFQLNNPVAFHVQKVSHQHALGIIHFDRVAYEIGGAWNNSTNHFIAPIRGIYYFQLTIIGGYSGDDTGVAHIQKGNIKLQVAHATPYSGGPASVIIQLEQNEQISANLAGGIAYGRGDNGPYTHFIGFLLYQL